MLNQRIYINGLSVIAPGMEDSDKSLSILRGDSLWQIEELSKMLPASLPANEARRTTPLTRLALKASSLTFAKNTSIVFASSEGDLYITDKICQALAQENKLVSPTLFHNSVHNAPAGYFSIAQSMQTPSVSLSTGDYTFSSGLIDAFTQVVVEKNDVLFVAYDYASPKVLEHIRYFKYPFANAFVLSLKEQNSTIGSINMSISSSKKSITPCFNKSIEDLRLNNPIALGLPLLEALTQKMITQVVLPYMNKKQLLVRVNYA